MKRIILLLTLVVLSSCAKKIEELHGRIDSVENRIEALESSILIINQNIASLQSIIDALQEKNYITSVEPIITDGVETAYVISFENGSKITIYHGKDGKDGYSPVICVRQDTDGNYYWTLDGEWLLDVSGNKIPTTGEDGYTPVIGVRQDTADGKYYWTLDGEWLLDASGIKVPTTGEDGEDGYSPVIGVNQDTDGNYYWTLDGDWLLDASGNKVPTTGKDGTNGKDGVTPKFKIENDFWYVSYDEGNTWSQLSSSKGDDGDSFFTSVTSDNRYVYFILSDGTTLTVPKVNSVMDKVQSITYIPRYSDGAAVVVDTPDKDFSFVEFDLEVSPKEVITELEAEYVDYLTVKAVKTVTRAVTWIDLPIISFTADKTNGIITVKASGKNMSEEFFSGIQKASAVVQLTDGNTTISSGYVPILAPQRIVHQYEGVKIVAHRGYWNITGSAQNSITALRKANEIGVWGCEVDIWETSDNVLVVNHDATINDIMIQSSPYSAIQDITLSNGETLPTFEQYLTTFKNECSDMILVIEIKPHATAEKTISATSNAVSMVKNLNLENLVEYISFSPIACDAVVKYAPTARVSYLEADLTPLQCAERGYTGVDYHYSVYNNNATYISMSHEYGLDVNIWTINDAAGVNSWKNAGVDIITTDYPEQALSWAGEWENSNVGGVGGENSNVEYE